MTYAEAQKYLIKVRENGTKLSLDNIERIIRHLPFSLSKIKFIQVAGTNGKGSTSHFITSIIKSSNKKVGLFTSPHLQNIRERISVNKTLISENDFAREIGEIENFLINLKSESIIDFLPTFFEHMLLLALFYFNTNSVDFAVLEVGLGGRLDATTAIKPILAIITNISLDHTKTLGKRITDIAKEKAGIAKKGVPLICGCKKSITARKVIKNICDKVGAEFHYAFNKSHILKTEYKNNVYKCLYKTDKNTYDFEVSMNGVHQTLNAATAIKAIEIINNNLKVPISLNSIKTGIKKNFVPGRIELIKDESDIIIDAGHNTEGIKALCNFLQLKNYRDCTLIFGVLRDKNYKKMVEILKPFMGSIILVEPKSNRALAINDLQNLFKNKISFTYKNDYKKALNHAIKLKKTIIITGSIYMIGEMRNLLIRSNTPQ